MEQKLKTAKWVSELLGVKTARIYELCREDKNFPFILIGQRQYRFSESALMRWIEGGGNRQSEVEENA
ncbi:MAG: helix-turn-helix domain-containing protein [Acidobacteriota bacterium]|jgi:excisionase family DNA binding protein|nr:helix-turn-helix domain-containing protein [Acidobacteriota bacterium]